MTEQKKIWFRDLIVQQKINSLIRKAATPHMFYLHHCHEDGVDIIPCHSGSFCRALHKAVMEISKAIDEFEAGHRD